MKEITILGNLGANAVQRATSNGKDIMTFSVAVNDGRNVTTWFNCVANYREKLFPYLIKGQPVIVVGDLTAQDYNGKIDLSVNVDKMELCGTKKSDEPVGQTETENDDVL